MGAKARAIYGKRLTNNNYKELLRLSNVSDVCGYLKSNTSYSKYLKGINETIIHRGQLENLLNRSRIEKYFDLLNFDFTKDNGFYHYIITSSEVHVIIGAITLINSSSSENIITELPSFLQEHICFDLMELSRIKNYDNLLVVLEHTPYKNVLKPHHAPNGSINLRECELSLKTYYYKNILESIDKYYSGKTKKELTTIVKIEIELLNLSIMYRLKKYFNKSPEDIKMHLLPFYYKLNDKLIDELLEPQPKEEYIKKMRLNAYDNKMRDVEFNYVEDYTKRLKYIISRKMMRFSTNAPISFYALMLLTQIEIDNIIIIIEGIRYNDKGSQIQKLLVLE